MLRITDMQGWKACHLSAKHEPLPRGFVHTQNHTFGLSNTGRECNPGHILQPTQGSSHPPLISSCSPTSLQKRPPFYGSLIILGKQIP